MKKTRVSAIVLVYNEEIHIERCLQSLDGIIDEIFVVDSFSSDRTIEIAKKHGAKVYQNKWEKSYSKQLNWGLTNLPINSDWVLRIDADEYIEPSLKNYIKKELDCLTDDISGVFINRRIKFLGKEIRHGGKRIEWQLRIFKFGKGYCEKRWMDEHIKLLEGNTVRVNVKLVDDNLNNLTWWIEKHNNYAVREVLDVLNEKYCFNKDIQLEGKLFGVQAERKRFLKKYYNKLPVFLGPLLYFLYRYLIQLGFLDGKKGFVFHFMQGLWYRFLVNVKVYEIESKGKFNKEKIVSIFRNEYRITMEL